MLVTYTSPNRAHHYAYAKALLAHGCLQAFVCGFPRFSPRARLPEFGRLLVRADHLQNLYVASLRIGSTALSDELSYLSKRWLDRSSFGAADESDIFLFYNGAG